MKAYSTQEAGEILSVCKETVVREIKNNRIKAFKVGKDWRIHESRLMEYMDVVANNYKTKKEVELEQKLKELEKENNKLKNVIVKISTAVVEINT
ncbi:helix-turn-helix domain-containing protein [Clostridium intestinale]|uniref:DNA binding domain-containing protein, excisionase family n=1 Tax=Clostridium intestinale DSM 6191 TaxID=1121320 RepID=A0A1M5TET1_9CLOT|nr:helix-turn-helix domain-containing protein [Clostridium intestinale]SHH48843.1 DNA binding domain-containing protein, excisionase family [Clostridium intestinale DSM 6191]